MESSHREPSFHRVVPEGDTHERMVCKDCGWIHYENPRIVVAAVAAWGDRILLARRAIEPREGFWTVPGGFMEVGESTREGALRETVEETGAEVKIDDLLGVYSLPHIGQVHMVYRGRILSEKLDPGPESHEAEFFAVEDIPWSLLAFPTNKWALEHFLAARDQPKIIPFSAPDEV